MKLVQNIIGTKLCQLTTYATGEEESAYLQNALSSGAKKKGISSNTSRQFKKECDKRIRNQGAYDTKFFPA
jgi:hypothetical protein